ncbi:MAG: hypothetical protein NXI00_24705, partial [Cytophagales bacterium]|nr:hypothetical protein [Cytophagales bacterium]
FKGIITNYRISTKERQQSRRITVKEKVFRNFLVCANIIQREATKKWLMVTNLKYDILRFYSKVKWPTED